MHIYGRVNVVLCIDSHVSKFPKAVQECFSKLKNGRPFHISSVIIFSLSPPVSSDPISSAVWVRRIGGDPLF